MATVKPLYLDPQFGTPTEAGSTATLQAGSFKAVGVGGIAFDASSNKIINLPDPTSASEPATKAYADNIAQGITLIPSVRVLATGNQTLSGLPSIDGVQLVAGDRILCIGQTNPVTNGVYLVASGAWQRPTASGTTSDWTTGRNASSLSMFIREGASFADQGYTCITDGNPKIDTDPVAFTQYTGLGEVTTGSGLVKSAASGNTISISLATASGLQFTSGALDHLLNTAGGLKKDASGLAVALNGNNTLAVDSSGLRTLGLPSQFTVNGTQTSSAVTAANLNTLTAGTSSLADSLHQHTEVLRARSNGESLTNGSTNLAAGDPVAWGSTADILVRADALVQSSATGTFGIAVAAVAANASGTILRRGVAVGVLSQATPGTAYFLAPSGGLTTTLPTAANASVVRIGFAKNATDLEVNPVVVVARGAG